MPDPRAVTVVDIRAEDVAEGDIIKINGSWYWVLANFGIGDSEDVVRQALEEYAVDELVIRDIRRITAPTSDLVGINGAYVAIVYANASVSMYGLNQPGPAPTLGIAAFALYDLLPAQIKEYCS